MIFFNFIGIFHYFNSFMENGFLPYPFVFDKNDTFMDFYNPLWWSMNGGFYSVWNSVYPPLNYFILKLISIFFINNVYPNPFELRDFNFNLIYIYVIFYFISPLTLFVNKNYYRFRGINKFLIYILSLTLAPCLFMLERGNLIILAVFIIPILLVVKKDFVKALIIAILINLKPYFVVYLFYFIAKRNFKYFLCSICITIFLYIFFGIIVGDNYWLVFDNLFSFAASSPIISPRELISFPSSIGVYIDVIQTERAILEGTRMFGDAFFILNILANVSYFIRYLLVFLALGYILKYGIKSRDEIIFFILTIIITHMGSSVGGYSLVYYVPFIPLFFRLRKIHFSYLILFVLIMFNYDFLYIMLRSGDGQLSFLSNTYLTSTFWELGISSILRPAANALLFILILRHLFKYRFKNLKYL